jgi:hypothetical protein
VRRGELVLLMGAAALLLPASAAAEGIDGSAPLVCNLTGAEQCDGVAACIDVTLPQIDLPDVVHLDFAAKRLASLDGQRTSPISAVEKLDAVLVIQGHQNGRGWTMVIDRATGHLSASIVDTDGGFVLAGACTTR